jgi:hypothetical protein
MRQFFRKFFVILLAIGLVAGGASAASAADSWGEANSAPAAAQPPDMARPSVVIHMEGRRRLDRRGLDLGYGMWTPTSENLRDGVIEVRDEFCDLAAKNPVNRSRGHGIVASLFLSYDNPYDNSDKKVVTTVPGSEVTSTWEDCDGGPRSEYRLVSVTGPGTLHLEVCERKPDRHENQCAVILAPQPFGDW